jgi:hypothetical protein
MLDLELIFDKSKYNSIQRNQFNLLKDLIKEKLTIGHAGGLFLINSEFLSHLDLLQRKGYTVAVIQDNNGIPTQIDNVAELLDQCMEKYAQEMNQAIAEVNRIRSARTVQELVNYEFPEKK